MQLSMSLSAEQDVARKQLDVVKDLVKGLPGSTRTTGFSWFVICICERHSCSGVLLVAQRPVLGPQRTSAAGWQPGFLCVLSWWVTMVRARGNVRALLNKGACQR